MERSPSRRAVEVAIFSYSLAQKHHWPNVARALVKKGAEEIAEHKAPRVMKALAVVQAVGLLATGHVGCLLLLAAPILVDVIKAPPR